MPSSDFDVITGPSVPRLCLRRAQDLFEREASYGLPHVGEKAALVWFRGGWVPAQGNLTAFSILHAAVPAVDFHRRSYAGEHEVCAPHALALEPLHPVASPAWQIAVYIGPITDGGAASRSYHEVNRGTERCIVASVQS